MEQAEQIHLAPPFNEDEWLKLVFLLSDTQHWLNGMVTNAMHSVPIKDKKKLMRKTYRLTIEALAHIMERHYYKIPRHPNAGKFTIPVTQILSLLREANRQPLVNVTGTHYQKREIDGELIIGHDYNQIPTSLMTVVSDTGGRILTAFPGKMKEQTSISNL